MHAAVPCHQERRAYQPLNEAIDRLRSSYGLEIAIDEDMLPVGICVVAQKSALTLVTTVEFLADPVAPDVQQVYEADRTEFVFVGPLLDKAGAKRAAGHKIQPQESAEAVKFGDDVDPLTLLRNARAADRKVVFASMGTVITGDMPELGWANRIKVDGVPQGLSGQELCQAAWGGLFDCLGAREEGDNAAPLLLVSVGPQQDALENMSVPANAFCLPVMPQVDILKEGVDMFLTHGGQNSFMESLSMGVPVLVCPGFADQPVNAEKAVQLGVGLQVERPMCDASDATKVAAKYRQDVAEAVDRVFTTPAFRAKAEECALQMRSAGGLPDVKYSLMMRTHATRNTVPFSSWCSLICNGDYFSGSQWTGSEAELQHLRKG